MNSGARSGNPGMARVSDLTSYIYCPRLCYYRLRFADESPNEMHAAREIYVSRRMGMDDDWALNKYVTLYGEDNTDVFVKAREKFVFSSLLDELRSVEVGVRLESGKLRLKGILDEVVLFRGDKCPLVLSSKAPNDGVWFRDKIKVAAFCMLLESGRKGFVYHCFDGSLREVEITSKERYYVLKLIERVLRLQRGFIPETGDEKKCSRCAYKDVCKNEPSTFASRFL
jgi:CRISPR-associated exonuclease Cas4